jgi:hypothetical protein
LELRRNRDGPLRGEPTGEFRQDRQVGAWQAAGIEIASPAWPLATRIATLTIDYTRASGIAYRTTSKAEIDGELVFVKTYRRSRSA